MKSALPYYGLAAPELKRLLRPHLAAYSPDDRESWEATLRALWDEATHREERYAALALGRHRVARTWRDPASLDLWRHLVVTGAWWDLVDETASHLVGDVLDRHRAAATPTVSGVGDRRRPLAAPDGGPRAAAATASGPTCAC